MTAEAKLRLAIPAGAARGWVMAIEQLEMGKVVKGCRAKARAWAMYGRTYRVVRVRGRYWARGAARGLRAHYLDRLGCRETRAEMQAALDRLARSRGATEVKS